MLLFIEPGRVFVTRSFRFPGPGWFPVQYYNRLSLFRDRAGLLRDLEDAVEPLAQCRHILPDLVIGDFSIDLGRGDPFMSQHLADGFQRYALRKRNRRGEGVPHVWQHVVRTCSSSCSSV